MSISIFDVTGPVAVGPSSSHTAGAIRIGNAVRIIAGGPIISAEITFFGSFAKTYGGHGTDLAIVGGMLGLPMDSADIRRSLSLAREAGLKYAIKTDDDPRYHPNTVVIAAASKLRRVDLRASSVGGGAIRLNSLNGYDMDVSCNLPTVIIPHDDRPGMIAALSGALANAGVNIASMKLSRSKRGGQAVAVIETDSGPGDKILREIGDIAGVSDVIAIPKV